MTGWKQLKESIIDKDRKNAIKINKEKKRERNKEKKRDRKKERNGKTENYFAR
jgi:hypothetical protein